MSRREDRSSDSKRHRSRFDREPSPKRSRSDGKPATERPHTNLELDKDHLPRDQNHYRRLQDALPLVAPLGRDAKVEAGIVSKESEEKVNGNPEGSNHSSDPAKVPRSRGYFQHDDCGVTRQDGRGFSRRTDSEHGWWRDQKAQLNNRAENKMSSSDTRRKDEKAMDNRENNMWRHDGYFEMEASPKPPAARKRPSFSEQKITTADPEKVDKSATAAPAANPVIPNPEDRASKSEKREERMHYSRYSDKPERSFAQERESSKGSAWRDSIRLPVVDRLRTFYRVRMAAPHDGPSSDDDRIQIWVEDGIFMPDNGKVSRYITSRFRLQTCDEGYSWKYVTPEQRQWYWEEFVRQYRWEAVHDGEVRSLWFRQCATLYRRTIHAWRISGRHPPTCTVARWAAWTAAWQQAGWQARAAKNRENRQSKPAGPGTGTTKHIAGSKSYAAHSHSLRERHGRDPSAWELYAHTHRHDDGSFVDERSRRVHAMEAYIDESLTPSQDGTIPSPPSVSDVNSKFKAVTGGPKKGRMYGCGSMASMIYPENMAPRRRGGSSSSSTSSTAHTQEIERLREENDMLKERMSSLEAQVRLLVAGLPQVAPSQPSVQPYDRPPVQQGSAFFRRFVPGPSHASRFAPGSSSRRRYSQQYVDPSQDFGCDDDDSDEGGADYDDDETQAP